MSVAYRYGTPNYAQVSVQVSVSWRPTGLEPATFGATIRRYLFLEVAECCRIGLSKPIPSLEVARCYCVLCPE